MIFFQIFKIWYVGDRDVTRRLEVIHHSFRVMAKKTIKQQYEELAKFGECFEQEGYGGWSLVIDEGGERALYKVCYNNREELCARWQKIKYTCPKKEDSWPRPYITINGVRHYLDNFMRCA